MAGTADESTTGRHIPALDGLRGTAVLMILFFHLYWSNTDPVGNALVRFVAHMRALCWVGVDLFFVLSGFLLTGILYDTLSSTHFFRNFYGRRSLRIFPLYYAFLFVVIAVSYAQGYTWFSGTWYYLTYTVSLLRTGVAYTNAPWVNMNHFWSLAIEEQFYVAWPLLMYLLRTKKRIAMAIVTLAVASLCLRIYLVTSGATVQNPYLVYAWSPARFDALLLGGLLALGIRSRFRGMILRRGWLVFACGAGSIGGYILWHGNFDALRDGTVATIGLSVLAITFTSLIAASLTSSSVFAGVFSNHVLRFFGRYSYGLYVYHYTLQSLMDGAIQGWLRHWTQSKLLLVVLDGSLVLLATVVLAVISFELFEKRFLTLKKYFHDETPTPKLRQDISEAEREASAI